MFFVVAQLNCSIGTCSMFENNFGNIAVYYPQDRTFCMFTYMVSVDFSWIPCAYGRYPMDPTYGL